MYVPIKMDGVAEEAVPLQYRVMEQHEAALVPLEGMIVLDPFKITRERLKIVQEPVVVATDEILAPVQAGKVFMGGSGMEHGEIAEDI